MSHTATLDIDLSALSANYRFLQSKLAGKRCGAVVKANAYGLGMDVVAPHLAKEGCTHFFVATIDEAAALRKLLPDATIYVFNGLLAGDEDIFITQGITPVLNDITQVERWEKVASKARTSAALHIDTGITRLGLTESDALILAEHPGRIANARITLIMSHLACSSEPEDSKNAEQLQRFEKVFRRFLQPMAASFANSAGILLSPDYHYDLVRPGCALYGIKPAHGENPMRHVATLSAPLLQVRTLDRDEGVGYGCTYPTSKGSRIAIAGLGYADGYMRLLSNKGFAYVAGHKVPFAGRVSMDMIALDVSTVPEAKITPDIRAKFVNAEQTVNDIARACDTIGYEIFTRIGARVKRVYG